MRTRFLKSRALAPASLVVAALALPATAVAAPTGSIVFVKSGNIFRAHADGSGVKRVTRDGTRAHPYTHPSQADNGTIVATRNDTTFYRFTPKGKRVGKPRKIATGLRNKQSLHDLAFSPAVSPNGKEVAVQNTLLQGTYDPSTSSHGMTLVSIVIQVRSASTGKKLEELQVPGDYLESPSWMDNSHFLFFKPLASFSEEVHVHTRKSGSQPWFADDLSGTSSFDRQPLDEGELTRAQDKLALIRGTNIKSDYSGSTIEVYAVSGFSQAPRAACAIPHSASGPFAKPTWSPDGSTLAWSDGGNIYSSPVDPVVNGCGLAPKRIVSGGVTPDWGPKA